MGAVPKAGGFPPLGAHGVSKRIGHDPSMLY